ncbi:MAG: hypothetical protein WAU70_13930 [Flavobacteriales bacterium]
MTIDSYRMDADQFVWRAAHETANVTNPCTVTELSGIRIAAISGVNRPMMESIQLESVWLSRILRTLTLPTELPSRPTRYDSIQCGLIEHMTTKPTTSTLGRPDFPCGSKKTH